MEKRKENEKEKREENEKLIAKISKLKMENEQLKREMFDSIRNPKHVSEVVKENFSGFVRELILHEFESTMRNNSDKRLRFTDGVRTFAQTVYLNSPRVYRYMRTLFKLPSNPVKNLCGSLKTNRAEWMRAVHGTEFGEDHFLGEDEDEPRLKLNRQVEKINESDDEKELNDPGDSSVLNEPQQTEEGMISLKEEISSQLMNLFENSKVYIDYDDEPRLEVDRQVEEKNESKNEKENVPIEDMISIKDEVSSQLMNMIMNAKIYFEDGNGNTIPLEPELKMEVYFEDEAGNAI